jgi:protein disulfide-isomerase-like protein
MLNVSMSCFGFVRFIIVLALVLAKEDTKTSGKSNVVTLTSSNFNDEVKSGFWLLEFYAPWCGHCKKLAPLWDELSVSQSTAKLGKIDVPQNEDLGKEHEIKGFPTIKYAKDGKFGKYTGPRTKGWSVDPFFHIRRQ